MQTRVSSRRRGFTMMEIMVVVAILAILVALTIVIGRIVRNNALEGQTKATQSVLRSGMGDFIKNAPEPSGITADWLPKLLLDPKEQSNITANKGYVPGSPPGNTPQILDAWGNPIYYLPSKNSAGPNPPVVPPGWVPKDQGFFWSFGPDGQPGDNDDLFSDPVAP